MEEQDVDISSEFTCFLCNGYCTLLGSIQIENQFIRLSAANGFFCEDMYYSDIASVVEEDPPTSHSLFLNQHTHSVYVCHLLRKDKLLKVFKERDLYKNDVKLLAEAFGFVSSETLKKSLNPHSGLSDFPESFDSRTRESKSKSRGSTSHIQAPTVLSTASFIANSTDSLSFPQTILVIDSLRPTAHTLARHQSTGTSASIFYTQPTGISHTRRNNKSKFNDEGTHTSKTKRKAHIQPTYENGASHLDNLKKLFPDYSSEDLQKVLSHAQNDFDLALSYILSGNDLNNTQDSRSSGQPLTITEI